MIRVVIPLLALVATSRAGAQTSLTLDVSGSPTAIAGRNDCGANFTVNWSVTATGGAACRDLVIWVTSAATCGDQPAAGDQTLGTVLASTWLSQRTGSVSLPVNDLPIFGGGTCPVLDVEEEHRVCAHARYSTTFCGQSESDLRPSRAPVVTYDTKPPAVPVILGVVAMDRALQVYFSAPSDAEQVKAYYRDSPIDAYTAGPVASVASGTVRVGGLSNGVVYELVLRAFDLADNVSDPSEPATGLPVRSLGFFAIYKNDGGEETGGCAVAPAGALPILALGWLHRIRRRRRPPAGRGLAAITILLALAPSLPARGQEAGVGAIFGGRPPGEFGTPRTMGVEVKLGGFTPLIDEEPRLKDNGATPYADTYGTNPMLLLELSGERQIFQAMGTASAGLSAGYAEKFAPAQQEDGTRAPESTGLRLFPLRLFGAYRFDYVAHRWGVPLVPYAKLGLNCTIWSITKGADLEITDAGKRAMGARFGWSFSAGLALLLDVFEPRMARDFDTDMGVNHSYLFAEYNHANVNFGPGFDLSARYFTFGFAFEI